MFFKETTITKPPMLLCIPIILLSSFDNQFLHALLSNLISCLVQSYMTGWIYTICHIWLGGCIQASPSTSIIDMVRPYFSIVHWWSTHISGCSNHSFFPVFLYLQLNLLYQTSLFKVSLLIGIVFYRTLSLTFNQWHFPFHYSAYVQRFWGSGIRVRAGFEWNWS